MFGVSQMSCLLCCRCHIYCVTDFMFFCVTAVSLPSHRCHVCCITGIKFAASQMSCLLIACNILFYQRHVCSLTDHADIKHLPDTGDCDGTKHTQPHQDSCMWRHHMSWGQQGRWRYDCRGQLGIYDVLCSADR